MTAREFLENVRERASRATGGPWVYVGKNVIDTPPIEVDEADWGPDGHAGLRVHTAQDARAYRYADAEFIAAARSDVPRLVAALTAALDLAEQWGEMWGASAAYDAQKDRARADEVRAVIEAALTEEDQ